MDHKKVLSARNIYNQTGDPYDNMLLCARLIALYDEARPDEFADTDLAKAHDHAIHMILVKVARIATGKFIDDNYVDIQGYAQIAHDIRNRPAEEEAFS